jgi:hypothetical protein
VGKSLDCAVRWVEEGEAVGDEADLGQLAADAGLESRVGREAWRAERRLDRSALQRLADALHLPVEVLACPGRDECDDTAPLCQACDASNEIDDHLLSPAAERVTAFLIAARQSVPALRRGLPRLTPRSWTESAELFASVPEFVAAATALQRLGGDLTAADLAQTGVAGLLSSDEQFDVQGVGAALARYAAHGDVECLDLVGLNACRLPDGPVPVAGWDLVRLGQSGIEDLMPVPAAARFMPHAYWDLTAAAATWWLRRSAGKKARSNGRYLDFSGRALHEKAAAPLLVLALADDAPLRPLSYYVVERGVAVHRTGGRDLAYDEFWCGPGEQDMQPFSLDHDTYAHFGGRRSQDQQSKWRHFCEVVGPMVEDVYRKASAGHQGAERLTRAARHFLDAVMDTRPGAPPRHRTILELSVALEVLLLTGNMKDWSRKFRNGAAWLGGRDDAGRQAIRKRAEALYKAGSDYRHGGELGPLYDIGALQPVNEALDVADCRDLTRQLLLYGLALLANGTPYSVAEVCARAQGQGETARRAQQALLQAATLAPATSPRALADRRRFGGQNG